MGLALGQLPAHPDVGATVSGLDAVLNAWVEMRRNDDRRHELVVADVDRLGAEATKAEATIQRLSTEVDRLRVRVDELEAERTPPPLPAGPIGGTEVSQPVPGGRFPGDAGIGQIRWGVAPRTVTDLLGAYEQPAATALGVHGSSWRLVDQQHRAASTARVDQQHGRLPWLTFALERADQRLSWTDAAVGGVLGELRQLACALGGLDGPVWVTIEPITEAASLKGSAKEWETLQRQAHTVFTETAPNALIVPVVTSMAFASTYPLDADDWLLESTSTSKFPVVGLSHQARSAEWRLAAAAIKDHGVTPAVWGFTSPEGYLAQAYETFLGDRVPVACYDGEPRVSEFSPLMARPSSINL